MAKDTPLPANHLHSTSLAGKGVAKAFGLQYADHRYKVWVVLPGPDTSGNDGTIRGTFGQSRPTRSCANRGASTGKPAARRSPPPARPERCGRQSWSQDDRRVR